MVSRAVVVDNEIPSAPVIRKDVVRNRARLLVAADEVFRERGVSATLDDVARQAGVGVATAYRHFANKQALIEALVEDRLAQAEKILEEALAYPDPRSGLEHFFFGVCEIQAADRGMRAALGGYVVNKGEKLRERMLPKVVALIERARAAGVVRPEFEATDIGPMIWMIGAVNDQAGNISPELWRRYLVFFLDGIAAEGLPRTTVNIGPLTIEEATSL